MKKIIALLFLIGSSVSLYAQSCPTCPYQGNFAGPGPRPYPNANNRYAQPQQCCQERREIRSPCLNQMPEQRTMNPNAYPGPNQRFNQYQNDPRYNDARPQGNYYQMPEQRPMNPNAYSGPNQGFNQYQNDPRFNDARAQGNPNYYQSNRNQMQNQEEMDDEDDEDDIDQDQFTTNEDRQLGMRIRDRLGNFMSNYPEVMIIASNGNVTLVGFIDKRENIQKLLDEVRKVDGVKAVNSDLKAKNE